MTLTPKHIIFLAVTNYLTSEQEYNLKTELASYNRINGRRFISVIEKYFDFKLLRDKPYIPEDIWLFNYLMYETNEKGKKPISEIGEKINATAGFKKTPLLRKYEKTIVIPQLKGLMAANKILFSLR